MPPLKMTMCFMTPMMSGSKIYRPPLLLPPPSPAEGNYPALHLFLLHKSLLPTHYLYIYIPSIYIHCLKCLSRKMVRPPGGEVHNCLSESVLLPVAYSAKLFDRRDCCYCVTLKSTAFMLDWTCLLVDSFNMNRQCVICVRQMDVLFVFTKSS